MTILKIFVVAFVGVVILSIIKSNNMSFASLIQLCLVGLIFISVIPQIKEMLSILEQFQNIENFSSDGLMIMMKVFGILTVGTVVGDICRDNGENAVANMVDISVKLTAVSCALPVFSAVVSMAVSFINR